jgi:hypothetical protein
MVGIIDSLLGLDIISILVGVGIGLVPSLGFLILRGTLFEYQEWRKRKQERKEWFNEVWRAANGIQEAWHYSGPRPEDEDRERTADEVDELTDKLREYKRHQNATDEMVEVMKSIIERWDRSRDIILTPHSTQPYHMRGGFMSDDAEELKELAEWEQKGRVRKFIYSLPERGRNSIERVRRWWYQRKDEPIPYEIHRAIAPSLSRSQLSAFIDGDVFLRVNREYGTDAVYYDSDEDKYNFFEIDWGEDNEIVVIDKYPGGTLSENQLLDRLEAAESVDTILYEDIVPDGQSLDEFEHSD